MKPLIFYSIIFSLLISYSAPASGGDRLKQNDTTTTQKSVKKRNPDKTKALLKDAYTVGLRTNLFRWATITPDIGVEWRVNRHWSVSADASFSNWTWNDGGKHYGLWEIAPQARYYLGANNNWYAGIQVKGGQYNYKATAIGHQGGFIGAGAIGGYKINLNKSFAIDFSLGLGYIYARDESYTRIDNVDVSKKIEDKYRWGPTSIGVTIVWMIQDKKHIGQKKTHTQKRKVAKEHNESK